MTDAPANSTDHGLFLAHFARGKTLYEQKRYAEAETQLEEAYFLRPRDPAVLNLLGLLYFRQQKLDKAEEVYRKLLVQSPDEATLSYNLGVIYLKLNRLEEAESALLKALDRSDSSARISFYLGTVYEKLRRFQDAIFHYRKAGASAMIQRIEGKLAAVKPKPGPRHRRPEDDTAEFKTDEVRRAIQQPPPDLALTPPKTLGPVSEVVLAARARTELEVPEDGGAPPPPSDASVQSSAKASEGARQDQTFRFLEPHLLEVDFSGKVFIKQGTVYSYSGDLTFWVKDRRQDAPAPLVIITGRGRLLLTDKEREITLMQVDDEAIIVEPLHLLACEETLTPRYTRLLDAGAGAAGLEFVQLEGRGMVALTAASRPLALTVTPDLPVSVPAASIIMWSGLLKPSRVSDREIYEVVHPPGVATTPLIRLEGRGRILMEQTRTTPAAR